MTIDEFTALITSIDPAIRKMQAIGQPGDVYSVYTPHRVDATNADNVLAEASARVQVDVFTKHENDPLAKRFFDVLHNNDSIICAYHLDFEKDSRYFHHIFDCEVF